MLIHATNMSCLSLLVMVEYIKGYIRTRAFTVGGGKHQWARWHPWSTTEDDSHVYKAGRTTPDSLSIHNEWTGWNFHLMFLRLLFLCCHYCTALVAQAQQSSWFFKKLNSLWRGLWYDDMNHFICSKKYV